MWPVAMPVTMNPSLRMPSFSGRVRLMLRHISRRHTMRSYVADTSWPMEPFGVVVSSFPILNERGTASITS